MSEDRTQAATKHRRQQARERGQVAHSPELTGAIGYYSMLAMTVNACELEAAPDAEVLQV